MLADGVSDIALTGGTHNPMAPCFHFLHRSYLGTIERFLPVRVRYEAQGSGWMVSVFPASQGADTQ